MTAKPKKPPVPQREVPQVIRFHSAGNHSQCQNGLLVAQDKKSFTLILMQPPIRIKLVSVRDACHITELDLSVREAKKQLRSAARTWGWGKRSKKKCKRYLKLQERRSTRQVQIDDMEDF